MHLVISAEEVIKIVWLGVITTIVVLFLLMAFEKKTLFKTISIVVAKTVFIKRMVGKKDRKKVIIGLLFFSMLLWLMFFVMLYINIEAPNLLYLLILLFSYCAILYCCITLGTTKYDDFCIESRIE